MGAKIARIISIVTILSVVCVLLCSCGGNKEPAYFLEAQETSSLVKDEAYFELDGNSIKAASYSTRKTSKRVSAPSA